MYTITVHASAGDEKTQTVYSVPEYEVKNGVLTLAIDQDHDLVLPLYHVSSVDILRNT